MPPAHRSTTLSGATPIRPPTASQTPGPARCRTPRPWPARRRSETRAPAAAQAAEVLDDRNLGAKQGRMHRAGEVLDVVDVDRVDPDQRHALGSRDTRPASPVRKGIAFQIGRVRQWTSQPVRTSTALPRRSRPSKALAVDRPRPSAGAADHHRLEPSQRFERQLRQVLAVGVAMERRSRRRCRCWRPSRSCRSGTRRRGRTVRARPPGSGSRR